MAFPKRKNNIEVYTENTNLKRRVELNQEITNKDVFLPDGILHDDLDLGMLNFVKDNLVVVSNGKNIPVLNKILTIQKWGEYTTNWEFTDKDNNIELPFISVVRKPDVQPGTNPTVQRTIPDREKFFYDSRPTWNGNQNGYEIYRIPQPVAVDISYDIIIVCESIRDLNRFNKKFLQKFTSRQSYTKIKGHFIPIVLDSIDDNTPIDNIEGRRFYLQTYRVTLLGFLLDPDEFEVKPAISRLIIMNEFIGNQNKRKRISNNIDIIVMTFLADGLQTSFSVGETIGVLLNVSVNGLTQERNVDYFHVTGTSRVSFSSPPVEGSIVSITYYKGKNNTIIDYDGTVLQFKTEYFTFTGGSLVLTLENHINSLISLDINGLIEDEGEGFVITASNEITLNSEPIINSSIGITYIY